jgi:hypothetical protein
MADERAREMYVGYLETPPHVRRFVTVIAPIILWIMVVVNAATLFAMRDPGDGVWDTGATRSLTGVLRAEPYPMLVTEDGRAVLLVEIGKRGAQARAAPLAGQIVTARGYPLTRGPWTMLELVPGDDALAAEPGAIGTIVLDPLRPVELTGEVLDAKCFLGAMKPGDGLAHRACAALCVRGGIPPMLAVPTPNGDAVDLVLLEGPDGDRFPDRLTRYMGRDVRIAGDATAIGGIQIVRVRELHPR